MNKFIFLAGLLIAGIAQAAQKAEVVCTKAEGQEQKCSEFEIRVVIETGKDVGLSGAYGIVSLSTDSGKTAFWTEEGGWSPYNNQHLLKAAEPAIRKLLPRKEFVIFKGSEQQLCILSNHKSFNLYAWYYGFNASELQKYRQFVKRFEIQGQHEENFWNAIMFYKSGQENKAGLIYSKECKKEG